VCICNAANVAVFSLKRPGARKDIKFEVRRTGWYVEPQI